MVFQEISKDALRARLREGAVTFAFRKLDGTLRTAVGTVNLSMIPETLRPNGNGTSTDASVRFFDLEKGAWRSLSSGQEALILVVTQTTN
jgi:hypothetical protein